MFDSYMDHQGFDDGRRRRAMSSTVLALGLTGIALSAAWFVGAMKVSRVSAPAMATSLEWSFFEPPAPAPPPPALGGGAADEGEDAPDEPETRPRREPEPTREAGEAPSSRKVPGVPGPTGGGIPGPGLPNGVPTGIGTTPCPGCIGTQPPKPPKPPTANGKPPAPVELSAMECRACPDPDPKQLSRTRAALTTRRPGTNVTSFCVDEGGRPYAIRTKRSFGDASVDRVALDTVKRWRFAPMRVGGETRKVCTTVSFHIEFR